MPASSTTSPGNVLAAAGAILNAGTIVVPSGTIPGTPYAMVPVYGNNGALSVPSNNLPTLSIYLFLRGEYTNAPTTYVPQIDVTWQPLTQIKGVAAGIPLTAPLILPVNTPIYYTSRVPLSNIGFNITAPGKSPATYNAIEYIISVSQ